MPPMNRMELLLKKIERRLGTQALELPEYLNKKVWANEVIAYDTLDTFSRYFPNALNVMIDKSMKRPDGYYVLDKYIDEHTSILGVRDIDWGRFSNDSLAQNQSMGYGLYSVLPTDYSMDDIGMIQMRADMTSIYNNQVFVDYKPPNLVRFESNFNFDVTRGMREFPITILIKHSTNLMTIPPTMMETFENLAEADVAKFLYEGLKYFEGLETVHANIDLRLGDFETAAGKRDDIVQILDDAHVSFSNKNQPMIITV